MNDGAPQMTKATFKICNLCGAECGLRARKCRKCNERPAFSAPSCDQIEAHESRNARIAAAWARVSESLS